MIHELQSFASLLFVLVATAGFLYGIIFLARQVDWRRVPEQCWRHPAYVPLILGFVLITLEYMWLAFGLTVEQFSVSRFTQGHVYHSTMKSMDKMMAWSGFLIIVLFFGEKCYVGGLRPLLQKVKAAMKP